MPIAKQMADALEAAHEKLVVHRDMKGVNVKVKPDGVVEVLDFGLAKALESRPSDPIGSNAPTIAPADTREGVILGTAAYMSPEQARGATVDRRCDIWSFAVVLFEMLTGKQLFAAGNPSDTLVAVLRAEIDWSALPSDTPAAIRTLLRRCLERDPKLRLRDIGEARIVIEKYLADPAGASTPETLSVAARRKLRLAWGVAFGIAAVAAVGLVIWIVARPKSATLQPIHIPVDTAPGVILFHDSHNPGVAVSPNGHQLVYAGSSQDQRLYLQDLNRPGAAAPIAGTKGALNPFFSSDGKSLAFVANNKLQKVALDGGEPVVLADATFGGGVWSLDDETIYFVPGVDQGIWKVPARGGKPVQITTPDRDGFDNSHLWPAMLPGNRLLYTSAYGRNRIMVLDLATGKRTPIIENGFFARHVSTGHLTFAPGHSLLAAAFDPNTLKVGNPVKIVDNIVTGNEQHAQYAISQTGTLAYFDGTSDLQRNLVRIDRNGAIREIAKGARPYSLIMSLGPDGRRLALTLWEGQTDVFIYDLQRDDFDRITLDPHNDFHPVWTPDGRSLVFTSVRRGQMDLYIVPADKSSPEELLYATDHPKWANSWSPDGQFLAFEEERPGTGSDVWIYSKNEKKARPFRNAAFNQLYPSFSPDGRWLAYQSDDLGKYEIYVAPYPGPGSTCKVSTSGGEEPHWSADGKELFYRRSSTAMVVDVSDRNFCHANPRALFEGLEGFWDVSPKGDFFITLARRDPPRLHLVLNWFEELKRLVPSQ